MSDPLDQTIMTPFVTDNGYEWAFIYFRALMFNSTYEASDVLDSSNTTDNQIRFVRRYWGSISDYIMEIDYDTLAELFEYWCEDEAAKLTLPEFTDIAVVQTGQTDQLLANTLYLVTDPTIDSTVVNETYAEQLKAVLVKANKELQKKVLFSEFKQGNDEGKLHQYERWLDAALLADMLTFVGSTSYDRLGIFVDLMATKKECWAGFQNTYRSKDYRHTMKSGNTSKKQSDLDYDESNYDRTELKTALDRIDKLVMQGRGLINNVAKGKLAGVRKPKKPVI